jgi:hypothetical protein
VKDSFNGTFSIERAISFVSSSNFFSETSVEPMAPALELDSSIGLK